MTDILSDEYQRMIANSVCHEAQMAGAAIQGAAAMHERPSAIYRPSISIDGHQWCALYGDNLQDGVAGFGDSPAAAMLDFDAAWHRLLEVPLNANGFGPSPAAGLTIRARGKS